DVIDQIVVTVVMQDDVPEFMCDGPTVPASGRVARDEYDGMLANVGDADTHKRVTNATEPRNDDAVVLDEPTDIGDRSHGHSPLRAHQPRGICRRPTLGFEVDLGYVLVWNADGPSHRVDLPAADTENCSNRVGLDLLQGGALAEEGGPRE